MNEKFTPGPWQISSIGCGFEIEAFGGEIVAQAQQVRPRGDGIKHAERKANANLIAAAPELYEALKILTEYMEFRDDGKGFVSVALAALAKARGEPTK
jgi:hypothetical protein